MMTGAHARAVAWLRRATLTLLILLVPSLRAADEKFPTLTVAGNTYSDVTVINKSATHVYITHKKGFASFRIKDLDPQLQTDLGYVIEEPPKPMVNPLTKLVEDPEIAKMQEEWTREANRAFATADPNVLAGIGAGLFVAYLLFSLCCFLICRKTGYDPGIWVWLPVAQFFSLFRAAKMSGWNFILMFIPIIGLIPMIVLCFKLCIARGKSAALGLFLLLPISSPLVFLYLAFADSLNPEPRGVVKLRF